MRNKSLLWTWWEKIPADRVVLIEATTGTAWKAQRLTDEANQLTRQLVSCSPGDRVAFRLPNGAEWFALFLALQKMGLAAVPLDGGLPTAGCFEIARRLGVRFLYIEGKFHSLGKTPTRSRVTCCVKVTSGSDGLPNAVECRPEHLIADGKQIIETMKIAPADRNLGVIPLGHSYGLGNLVMPLLLQGTLLVCASEYVPGQLIEWMERHRVTVFPGVPVLFRVLAALPLRPKLKSLRTVISAGALLSPAVARDFFKCYGIKIHNFYGSSETGGICYDRTGSASLSGRSVGKPLQGVSISFHRGQIKVKSAAVAKRGGQWLLNDCGEWNTRRELVLRGRLGTSVNIAGKKVHPLEVELALRALPAVTDVIVWMQPGDGREFLAAGVETALSRAKLEKALAVRLPAWKTPKYYHISKKLPRSARGKIDLAALRKLLETKIG